MYVRLEVGPPDAGSVAQLRVAPEVQRRHEDARGERERHDRLDLVRARLQEGARGGDVQPLRQERAGEQPRLQQLGLSKFCKTLSDNESPGP